MTGQQRFLDFIEVAPRSSKPRTRGQTCVGDEGEPLSVLRETLGMWGDYVDIVKFVPALLMMPHRAVEDRVRLYRDNKINVALDDPIFYIAYYQGKAEQLLRKTWDMGFTHCQIDTHGFKLGDPEREKKADQDHIKFSHMARDIGFKLWGEVGQKFEEGDSSRRPDGSINGPAIIKAMKALIADGCEQVFLESRVMRDALGDYAEKEAGSAQLREIVETVGLDHVSVEITAQMPFTSRNCHRLWAVRTFGPDVNFGGSTPLAEMRYVEAIRRGITFVPGPSKASSRLWAKSLAKGNGKAAADWWKEDYPIDLGVAAKLR
jgi:phosphosulfolactate synthase (CoM biosynthesis protein A)